ncbi:MAG: type II toxin-antitoxin system HicB family antitoxin [Ktedonobacterales bacterium]|jgi:predicted RNase H-like HicB family nuclease
MFAEYLQAAMRHAVYEQLEDDKSYYGSIPGFQGVWGNAPTLEACREELLEVLEDWVLFRIANQQSLPTVDGHSLTIKASV